MLPTPIPRRVRDAIPDARQVVFQPPPGMDDCGHLETLIDVTPTGAPVIRSFWQLEPIEMPAIDRPDRVIELAVHGSFLPPVSLAVWPAQLTVPPSAAGICWHDGHVLVEGRRMGVTALLGEANRAALTECRHFSADGR